MNSPHSSLPVSEFQPRLGEYSAPPPRVSVIVPCFNEEHAITQTIHDIHKALAELTTYELIIVNDGSTDGTAQVLLECQESGIEFRLVTHAQRCGYGASLKTGIRHSRANLIAITDADGTYPHSMLPELIARCSQFDMVVGARTGDQSKYPVARRIPSAVFHSYASWLAGRVIPDVNSGMRVFRRDIAESCASILPNGFSFTTTITLAAMTSGCHVLYIPVDYASRIGKSKIQPLRDTARFGQLILRTGMYFAPLRVFSPFIIILGLAFLVSFVYDIFWLQNLTDKSVFLMMFTMNTGFFALLADMIQKRTSLQRTALDRFLVTGEELPGQEIAVR